MVRGEGWGPVALRRVRVVRLGKCEGGLRKGPSIYLCLWIFRVDRVCGFVVVFRVLVDSLEQILDSDLKHREWAPVRARARARACGAELGRSFFLGALVGLHPQWSFERQGLTRRRGTPCISLTLTITG